MNADPTHFLPLSFSHSPVSLSLFISVSPSISLSLKHVLPLRFRELQEEELLKCYRVLVEEHIFASVVRDVGFLAAINII